MSDDSKSTAGGGSRGRAAGAVILLLVGAMAATGLLSPAERFLEDLRTRLLVNTVDSGVVVVAIDAASLKALNRWPWSRSVHAELLTQVRAAEPAALFFDVDFSVPSGDPGADRMLARALAEPRSFPVVLPAFWQHQSAVAGTGRLLTEPLPALAEQAQAGLVNMFPGPDGLVRSAVHSERFGSRSHVSAAALLAGRSDLQPGAGYPIDFRISPASFRYVSYADVLSGAIDPAAFRGKVVMIGATAVELGDNVPVPIHRTIPGVTLQAIVYETLVRGLPVTLGWPASLGLCVLVVTGWMVLRRRGWRAHVLAALAAAAAITGAALYLHAAHDVLLPAAAPLVTVLLCLFAGIAASAESLTLSTLLAAVRLHRQEALITGVFSASIDGILILDGAGRVRDANPAAGALFGIRPAALRGRSIQGLLPKLTLTGADGTLCAARLELRATTPRGAVPVEVSLSPAPDEQDGLVTVIVRDVTERHRQQAVLRHQATHDQLTRLPNRALLNRLLERLPADSRAALFMLDLDRFKQVNDTLGHGVGDEVLRQLGKRLRHSLPDDVKVFRIGGDEFAVLIPRYAGRAELVELAQRMVARVRAPVQAGGANLELGGSIGVALYPDHAASGAMLMQCADVAMYSAKSANSGIEFYDARADHNTLRNLKMTGALRKALDDGRIQLVYQPKVRLSDGVCTGVEALARWHDPELGAVSPAEFVPLAESSDMIGPLTRLTLERALRDHAQWCARGIDVTLAVNLSARHLGDDVFIGEVIALVDRYGIDPASLELEITESALMENPDRARAVLARLTRRGIRLAMDDFGTGFSSLAYLKHLNLHTLKIDRCFVQDLCHDASDRKIVASTLSMAHSLDLEVVAEGVEEPAQVELLAGMGCDIAQGFGLARPMDAAAFAAWFLGRPRRTGRVLPMAQGL